MILANQVTRQDFARLARWSSLAIWIMLGPPAPRARTRVSEDLPVGRRASATSNASTRGILAGASGSRSQA